MCRTINVSTSDFLLSTIVSEKLLSFSSLMSLYKTYILYSIAGSEYITCSSKIFLSGIRKRKILILHEKRIFLFLFAMSLNCKTIKYTLYLNFIDLVLLARSLALFEIEPFHFVIYLMKNIIHSITY